MEIPEQHYHVFLAHNRSDMAAVERVDWLAWIWMRRMRSDRTVSGVFGTPTYMLGERVISLGNPALQTLLELLDAEANHDATAATRVS